MSTVKQRCLLNSLAFKEDAYSSRPLNNKKIDLNLNKRPLLLF